MVPSGGVGVSCVIICVVLGLMDRRLSVPPADLVSVGSADSEDVVAITVDERVVSGEREPIDDIAVDCKDGVVLPDV